MFIVGVVLFLLDHLDFLGVVLRVGVAEERTICSLSKPVGACP